MVFPKTVLEFQAQFPDEESCWGALRKLRWPKGFVCPRCAHDRSYWIQTRRLDQCQRCRYQATVTAGTVFHRTRLPLRVWFWAIFFVARHKQGISALQLQRDTGLGSYQTAWTLLHKIRSTLQHRDEHRLVGLVEVDETYVGSTREKGLRGGREVGHKIIVAAAVEQRGEGAGAARLAVLEGITFENDVGPFVEGVIDIDKATVRTDGLASYIPLPKLGVTHDRRIQGPDRSQSMEILQWAHILFGNLKAWIRGTFHGVSKKHMPGYLDEFVYRFNRRGRDGELFGFILARSVEHGPCPYHRLIAESVG